MPISLADPFKGRQYPGEVNLQAVRWYLRYPLAYEHVAELLAERGLAVDASCIWRWVQAYSPELNRRCQPHFKRTNKSYRVDETFHEMPGDCQTVLSCVVTNVLCFRRSVFVLFGLLVMLRRISGAEAFFVGRSSFTPSPLPSALALWLTLG